MSNAVLHALVAACSFCGLHAGKLLGRGPLARRRASRGCMVPLGSTRVRRLLLLRSTRISWLHRRRRAAWEALVLGMRVAGIRHLAGCDWEGGGMG